MSEDKIGGEKAILEERRKKLQNLRNKGVAYANSFRPENNANEIHKQYGETSKDDLAELSQTSQPEVETSTSDQENDEEVSLRIKRGSSVMRV